MTRPTLEQLGVPSSFSGVCLHFTPAAEGELYQDPIEAVQFAEYLWTHGIGGGKTFGSTTKQGIAHALTHHNPPMLAAHRWWKGHRLGAANYGAPDAEIVQYVNNGCRIHELINEPNLAEEWEDGPYQGLPPISQIASIIWSQWLTFADACNNVGAYACFPAMSPGGDIGHRTLLNMLLEYGAQHNYLGRITDNVIAQHPRGLNIEIDCQHSDVMTCTFDEYRHTIETFKAAGVDTWHLATEHGWSWGNQGDWARPPVTEQFWYDNNREAYLRMNPAHAKAILPEMLALFYWVQGDPTDWPADSIDHARFGIPAPSRLWVDMAANPAPFRFNRYDAVPPVVDRPKGFDVSQAQVNINWSAGVTAGNEFAMIRFSTGLTLDTGALARHMPGSEGKRYIRFGYHAFKASVSAEYQARLLLGLCHEFPVSGAILDAEALGGAITPAMLRKFADTWDSLTSIPFIFYSSPSFIATLTSRGDISFLAKYPLWIAHWGVDAPTVPAPWTTWTFWQTGKVLGPEYYLPIDRDLYNGTSAQLWAQFGFIPAWCGDGTEPPQPPTELVIKDRAGTVKDWAWLTAEFGLTPANVMQGTGWRVTQLQEGGPAASLLVYGPPGTQVIWGWPDGRITETIEPKGYRGFDMGPGAYYFPPNTGPHYIEVGDCKITGLGMLGGTEHRHIDITIAPA